MSVRRTRRGRAALQGGMPEGLIRMLTRVTSKWIGIKGNELCLSQGHGGLQVRNFALDWLSAIEEDYEYESLERDVRVRNEVQVKEHIHCLM